MSEPPGAAALDFQVRRDDLRVCRFATAPGADAVPLAPGEALLRVEAFAFTANNITYAAFGEAMSYWHFFPAPEGWGRIPVWGFAVVERSAHDGLAAGERLYGYLPMSTHLVVRPERVDAGGFSDGAAHRRALHPVYNRYLRTAADPGYDPRREAEQMLLRPLFTTSFLIDDFLADNDFFGAQTVVLSSASSKTAWGTAFQLSARGGAGARRVSVLGLTSPANLAYTERLGCYDRVLPYDRVADLPADVPTVYVDMAGNAGLRAAVHGHLRDALRYSCAVGGTHWDHLGTGGGERPAALPGPKPALFFAPAQVKKRYADWGPGGLEQRLAQAWQRLLGPLSDPSRGWLRVVRGHGPAAVEQVYRDTLDGRTRPDEGHVLSL
jgi:hypothetical protein